MNYKLVELERFDNLRKFGPMRHITLLIGLPIRDLVCLAKKLGLGI